MNLSDHNTSSENATKRQFPVFLLPNSTSQACNGPLPKGPVKARRKMINLQLPAHEYLDTDETDDNTICAPYKRSKSGRGDDASHHINSSGSCLDVKSSTGLLADLNEPLTLQGSEPVPHNADVEGQSSQNGLMVLDAGHGGSIQSQRDLHIPSRSDNAVQPQRQSYPATDYSNVIFSRERAHREMEARSVNPQASYDSYVESTVASSNAPRLHNDYRPDFIRPWSHLSSPWKNPRCITDQHKEVNHLLKRDFDINLPCDDASVSVDQLGAKAFGLKKEGENKAANVRHCFDLNACASEDDDVSGLHSSLRVKTKGTFSVDLEAPPTLQSAEEEDGDSSQDELIKGAAEAIVAISLPDHPDDAASYSSTDVASKSQLSWFADIITSCGDELERKIDGSPQEYSSGEIDYFEAMTLSLQPTKEEDYMPEPLVPENMSFEGTGLNKPRRGKARRGRPKRGDFQRDTLPGLSSLSRHEVAEDIQLFGGLMRLRATGWGKATRRPRRQRCPPATVILT
ncbi:BnaA08g19820D [Brassica napus]|uniref:BnaA08g19820D protein n=1 Tax=Brassica napus TaxID=3708 RepID=A0A078J8B6_BRANA|nr:BnaA08g19820D [Brassica napus]